MNICKSVLLVSTLLATTSLWAQSSSHHEKKAPPYGDNPNLLEVLGYKTAQKVQETAEKVDTAAQKGIAKIKPKVDHAWENSKTYTAEQAAIAKENSQKAAQAVNQKWQETKHAVIGEPNAAPAPIIQQPLSQSSSNSTTTNAPVIEPVPAQTITEDPAVLRL